MKEKPNAVIKSLTNILVNNNLWYGFQIDIKCVFEVAFVKTFGKGGGIELIKTKLKFYNWNPIACKKLLIEPLRSGYQKVLIVLTYE